MKVYLATWILEKSQGETLTKMNKKSRLLSFYHTIEKLNDFKHYLKFGK